jgi:hypothetical protein
MVNAGGSIVSPANDWVFWLRQFQEQFRPGMSTYQIENFVIGRGGETPYGRWVQACRELYARIAGLAPDAPLTQIQAEDIATCLGSVLAYRQQFDVPSRELEIAEWVAVARVEAGADMLATGTVSKGTWGLLRALPPNVFREIAAQIKSDPDKLVETFLEGRLPPVEPLAIPANVVARAVNAITSQAHRIAG